MNNQTITRYISDVINFDNHHSNSLSIGVLDLPLYHNDEEIIDPESNFSFLPHEITLEVLHGQEPSSPPPELNTVHDEIEVQHPTSEHSHHQDPAFTEIKDEIDCLNGPLHKHHYQNVIKYH